MYFTQEDYKKIENWLHRNSVKDTEFQEALPFTGKEIVTIVQDGHNRKVNIQEFINQLYKHGVEDFLNVTNTYRANNITLKEAIRLIPAEARKEGQVITFLNTDGNWEIYQFIGKLNQWNNSTLWNNPFDWEKLIVNSILPDEEDLTKSESDAKGNAYLSLKNRKYEPDKYSGLGRKILRRRVVEIEDPVYGTQEKNLLLQADFAEDNTVYVVRYDFTLNGQDITLPDNSYIEYEGGSISDGNIIDRAGGLNRVVLKKNIVNGKNILTQEMVSKSNTIYEIRYDFDLNGSEITIPKRCVLDFQGGSFNNGSIIGNNTKLLGEKEYIFTSILIGGNWDIPYIHSSMFRDFNKIDVVKQLFALTSENIQNHVVVDSDCMISVIYYPELNATIGLTIKSNTIIELNANLTMKPYSGRSYNMLFLKNVNNVTIKGGGFIIGDRENHDGTTGEWGHGINILESQNINIKGLNILNCWGDGIYVGSNSKHIYIESVNLDNCRRQGISITGANICHIYGCVIKNINGTDPQSGIDIEPNAGEEAHNIYVTNTIITNCVAGMFVGGKAGIVNNVTIEGCNIKGIKNSDGSISTQFGLRISKSNNVRVKNNNISSVSFGVSTSQLSNISIEGLKTDDVAYPINNSNVDNLYMYNSILHANNSAFYSIDCKNISIRDSVLESNNELYETLDIRGVSEFTNLNNCQLINSSKVSSLIRTSGKIYISHCTLEANSIFTNAIKDSSILYSFINGAMSMTKGQNLILNGNTFNYLLSIVRTSHCNIINNDFNVGAILQGDYNKIIHNNFTKDSTSILVTSGNFCTISDNMINYIGENPDITCVEVYNGNSNFTKNVVNTNNLAAYGIALKEGSEKNHFDSNNVIGDCSSWVIGPIANSSTGNTNLHKSYGDSNSRPLLSNRNLQDIGFTYYDETINKLIVFCSLNKWVDVTGQEV